MAAANIAAAIADTAALRNEIAKTKAFFREANIRQFASNLEVARLVFRAHPALVKARTFPEPYRSAIKEEGGYDPESDPRMGISDLHITDPAKANRELARLARQCVLERHKSVSPQTVSAPPAVEPPEDKTPDWVNDTPPDNEYRMSVASDCQLANLETIDLSREEYIALKAHLAAIRGYASAGKLEDRLAEVTDQIESSSTIITPGLDQVTSHLQSAREMFRRCPDLVMLKSETIDADLDEIHGRASAAIPDRPKDN